MNKSIVFEDWGLINYNDAWDKQETLFSQTIEQKKNKQETENRFIFCEHPHVYTLGKSGNEQNLLLNYIQLQAKDASFVQTNRGGDITYHGPGQIVGYPIFDLENFNLGLKQYVHTLEEVVIKTLTEFGIGCTRLEGATGVWLDAGTSKARKICAIGVRCSHYVSMHGFALNVNTDLDYFSHINPCGFVDKGVTSMQQELGKEVDVDIIKKIVEKHTSKLFS